MSNNLLIGFAVNKYSNIESMRNFCVSLRKYYKEEAVLITDSDDEKFIAFVKRFGFTVFKTKSKISIEDLMVQRWSLPLKIIKDFPNAKHIILSDTRDLIYQNNPFYFLVGDELELTTETKTIGECPDWNSRWILQMYNQDILNSVKEQKIICGGYMCGSREGISKLCELIIEESKRYPKTQPGYPPIFVDQAAMNVFYKQGKLPSTTLHPTGGSFVATIGSSLGTTKLDEEGFLVTQEGIRPAVVHQYDRHPQLTEAFNKRLSTS